MRTRTLLVALAIAIIGLVAWQSSATYNPPLSGVTGVINPGAMLAGACATTTVTIPGATTSMTAAVSPTADPGVGFSWEGWVSAANTVSVRECALLGATPASITAQVRVIQ